MNTPTELYNATTLFTLSGASMAVWIITSVLGDVLGSKFKKSSKKWVALVLSLALSYLGVLLISNQNILTWVVATVNGFLIYLTAVGLNTVVYKSLESSGPSIRPTSGRAIIRFSESWW